MPELLLRAKWVALGMCGYCPVLSRRQEVTSPFLTSPQVKGGLKCRSGFAVQSVWLSQVLSDRKV